MLRLLFLLLLCALISISAGQSEVSAAAKPVLLYVHNNHSPDNSVFAFKWNKDGSLDPVVGSPFSAGGGASSGLLNCETMSFSARKKLLAVSTGQGLTVFRVAADGALTVVPGSPFATNTVAAALGVAFAEKGTHTYLYTTAVPHQVLGFEAASDGTLTPLAGPPAPSADNPIGIIAAKDRLFVAGEFASFSAYKVAGDGRLTPAPGGPFGPANGFTTSVQADPGAKFVYAADGVAPAIYAFRARKSDAALTPLAGSPFTDPSGSTLAVSPKWVFAISALGQPVQAFRRSGSGALTPKGDPQDSGMPSLVAGSFDPTGRFLALVDDAVDEVRSFAVNQRTGHLTLLDTETADLGHLDATGITVARL